MIQMIIKNDSQLKRTDELRPDRLGVKLFILQKFHKSRLLALVDSKVSRKILTKSEVTDLFHLLALTEAQFLTMNRLKILIKMSPDISVKRFRSKFQETLFIINNFCKNNLLLINHLLKFEVAFVKISYFRVLSITFHFHFFKF